MSLNLHKYKPAMLALPADRPLRKEDLLADDFLMHRNGPLEMYYSPHNEYVNRSAKVVIVGITPGWTQMKLAYEAARGAFAQGLSDEEACKKAKEVSRFAGSMRRNLINMLNRLELHRFLHISTSDDLFGSAAHLLHTTALLPFPVFNRHKNYTGANPSLLSTPWLRECALSCTREQLSTVRPLLIIPLGKTAAGILQLLGPPAMEAGRTRVLWGFPHPSGVNGHRHRQFNDQLMSMQAILKSAFVD